MSDHTPGPWEAEFVGNAHGSLVYYRINSGKLIGFTGVYSDNKGRRKAIQIGKHEAEANAHLIAAAPDLLEALEALQWTYPSDGPHDCPVCYAEKEDGHNRICALNTVIKKARGE